MSDESVRSALAAVLVWLSFAVEAHPAVLLSGAALAVTGALLVLITGLIGPRPTRSTGPAAISSAALRARARRTGMLRQRDPDAAGRPRPRAPSVPPAAA